jgi:hypothetical protein
MRRLPLLAAVFAAASVAAIAQPRQQPTTVVGSRIIGESTETLKATVESVDMRTRQVLLRRQDGSLLTYEAGPEIRNLPQVKAGDTVEADIRETLRITLTRGEAPREGVASGVAVAPEGSRPGAAEIDAVRAVGRVESVDTVQRTVAVQGPDGFVRQYSVPNTVNIARIQPGDNVSVTLVRRAVVAVRSGTPG